MAYIVQTAQSSTEATATASFVPDQWITETQKDDDYILLCAVNDGGGTALGIGAGWTELYKSAASIAGVRVGIWQAKRSGTDITPPTLTGANDDWIVSASLIRDADATTFLDVAIGTTEQTVFVTKYTAPSVTTTNNDALIIRVAGLDLNGVSTPADVFGGFTDVSRRSDTGVELYVTEQVKRTAGATGTFTWDRSVSRGGVLATIAIRNKTNGSVAPYSTTPFTVVEEFTLSTDSPTPVSIHTLRTSINGITCLTPGSGPTVVNQTSYTGDSNWYGPYVTVATTPDSVIGIYGGVFPITANWSAGNLFAVLAYTNFNNVMSPDGPIFYFEDNVGAWRAWRPISRVLFGTNNFKGIIADLPNETFLDSSGSIDWANIVYFGMLCHNTTANLTARSIALKALGSISTIQLLGGGTNRYLSIADFAKISYSGGGIYRGFLQGSGQTLMGIPVQIGNGSDTTYFKGSAQSLEYQIGGKPTTPWFRLGELDQPITIYGSASDVMNFDSSIIATTTRQPFTIHASSSISGSYSFVGASIVGWDVTWKTGINCEGATFSNCGEIDAKGAQFNDCIISETRSTSGAILFTENSSMTDTTINLTGTTAAYHIELGTNVTEFSLTNVTFTGTPGTDKIHVKKTSGTVTITAAGTTSLVAGDITSDGATIVLVSGAQITLSGLVSGSEVRAYVGTPSSSTVIDGTESSGTSFTFSHSVGGQAGFIVIRKLGYKFIKISLTYANTDTTIPIQQQEDPWYNNP